MCSTYSEATQAKRNTDDGATHLNSLEKYTIARATHNNQLINHIMNYIHRKMSEEGEREKEKNRTLEKNNKINKKAHE